MNLETIDRRKKIVENLLNKSFKLDKLFLPDEDNYDDWNSNIQIMTDLISLERTMRGEEIFICMLDEMENFPSDAAEKKILASIAANALNYYVSSILFDMLLHTQNALESWHFKTAIGKRFHRNAEKKIGELIAKYRELYFIDDDSPAVTDFEIKWDTSADRVNTVMAFFKLGAKISDEFRKSENQKPGEILALMAIMEKLTAIVDAIRTEMLFEDALNDMLDIKDESKLTSKKFLSPFAKRSETFMKEILLNRIELLISFADKEFDNPKLMDFQEKLTAAMVALRKKYAEIYHI